MVKIIALISQKGGSGKSTLARNIGVEAAKNGHEILILDADPQATVLEWYKDREASKRKVSPFIVGVEFSDLNKALIKAQKQELDYVILDTPGRYSSYLDKIINLIDFCLVPCRTTRDDIKAQIKTAIQLNQLKADFSFVATQAPIRGFRRDVTFECLASLGNVSPVQVPYLMDFQDGAASGLAVNEINSNSRASQSIKDLWLWLENQINRENIP